jgi:hypothetical protein
VPFKSDEADEVFKKEIAAEIELLSGLKRKYPGIFAYMCGKCQNNTMLLHLPACIHCGHHNMYFEEAKVDDAKTE